MPTNPICDEQIRVGAINLHYVQWGEQGQPVIFIHGLTANAFCFQAFADTLAQDHRVIAYDLRGRGTSDKPESGYSVPTHAADLARLIDALELARPVVVGHSLGAMIALYLAANYPEKLSKLVLIDAGGPLPEKQPAWLQASIERLGTPIPSFDAYLARLKMAPFLGPYWNEYADIYIQHDVKHNPDGSVVARTSRACVIEEGMNFKEARPVESWPKVQVPTLLLRAGQGMFFDNDQLLSEEAATAIQRGITGCRYIDFPKLNHYTIIFGVESGPAQAIRKFIDEEQ